jgi:hypothetical protein
MKHIDKSHKCVVKRTFNLSPKHRYAWSVGCWGCSDGDQPGDVASYVGSREGWQAAIKAALIHGWKPYL